MKRLRRAELMPVVCYGSRAVGGFRGL